MKRKHKMALRRLREDVDVAKNASTYLFRRCEKLAVELRDLRIRVRDLEPRLPEPDEEMLAETLRQLSQRKDSAE